MVSADKRSVANSAVAGFGNGVAHGRHQPISGSVENEADLIGERRTAAPGANTIRHAEVAEEETSLTAANELAVRRALEAAGVEFIDENGGGPGGAASKAVRGKSGK
jgi:hypothetical protein